MDDIQPAGGPLGNPRWNPEAQAVTDADGRDMRITDKKIKTLWENNLIHYYDGETYEYREGYDRVFARLIEISPIEGYNKTHYHVRVFWKPGRKIHRSECNCQGASVYHDCAHQKAVRLGWACPNATPGVLAWRPAKGAK